MKNLNKHSENDFENDIDQLLDAFAEWQFENSIKNIDPLSRKTQKNNFNDIFFDQKFPNLEISSDNSKHTKEPKESKIESENLVNGNSAFNEINKPVFKQSSSLKGDNPSVDVVKVNPNSETIDSNILLVKAEKPKPRDFLFYSILIGCLIAGLVVIIATGFCLYAMNKSSKLNNSMDYPQSYGNSRVQSKNVMRNGDKGLAHSAQMYHYQHQKQQMIAMEKATHDLKQDHSDNSEGETDEGDYTVYECPGLAPTGEMEVKNPLFKEDFGLTAVSNAALNLNQQLVSTSNKDPKIVKDDSPSEDSANTSH